MLAGAMVRASARRLALLLACAAGTTGCSFLTLRSPPAVVADPSKPFSTCQAPPPQAITDTILLAGYAGFFGVAVSQDRANSSQVFWSSALLATLAGSAIYGYAVGSRCADLDELGRRCRKKDLAACLALNPDFDPARPIRVPLICARDADCPPRHGCVQSACIEAPPASPPR
jgi:hypothetical protein